MPLCLSILVRLCMPLCPSNISAPLSIYSHSPILSMLLCPSIRLSIYYLCPSVHLFPFAYTIYAPLSIYPPRYVYLCFAHVIINRGPLRCRCTSTMSGSPAGRRSARPPIYAPLSIYRPPIYAPLSIYRPPIYATLAICRPPIYAHPSIDSHPPI
jgi:hypothetical protein